MTILIATIILQWVALAALGIICFALARQVGVLHQRIAPAGALMIPQKTISIGEAAPQLSLDSIQGKTINIGDASSGRAMLIFFLSPDCHICQSLLPVLRSCGEAEKDWVDILLASDGDDVDHTKYVEANNLKNFDYVVSETLGRHFAVAKLPYGVLIDENAHVKSMGLINTREHLESLFEAKDRNVSSLQEFLAQTN